MVQSKPPSRNKKTVPNPVAFVIANARARGVVAAGTGAGFVLSSEARRMPGVFRHEGTMVFEKTSRAALPSIKKRWVGVLP